ncbi:MAG: helix-turn-helix transcriptional regulator [Ferruginibacter sp.]
MEPRRTPNKLKLYRRCNGFSQKKVARMLGLRDTSLISRWEHGVSFPSLVQSFRLSRIYQVLPHQLYESLWNLTGTEQNVLAQGGERVTTNPLLET